MSFQIFGLGTAVPQHTMSQVEATELAQQVCCENEEQGRLLKVLYRKAGVQSRNTVLPYRIALDWVEDGTDASAGARSLGPTTRERMQFYEEYASLLAREAASEALTCSGISPKAVTHLITVSCTGFVAPGVDIDLMEHLKLAPTTERIHVGFMGCHGMINGLRTALAISNADPQARVLLCATELCSLHYRFRWDPERFIGNALFADGAAAMVGGAGPAAENGHASAVTLRGLECRVSATGSCLLPNSKDAMTWRIGDYGFEMTLSPRVPDLIAEHLRPWLCRWLERQGTALEAVGSWAVHPGGPRILTAVEESLGLPPSSLSDSRQVLSEHGNMSSPTVLFILKRLLDRQAPRPCVMLAFGPGLVAEAALTN